MGTQTIVTREPFFYGKLVWRFLTGNFMDGIRRGDSTWLRKATDQRGRLNRWTRMSRLKRAFIRWALTFGVALGVVAYLWSRDLFWVYVGLVAAYLTAKLFIWLDFKLFHHYHTRDADGNYTVHRARHHRVMRRIDKLPPEVAKLFGGHSGE
jgi:hypothetical protein